MIPFPCGAWVKPYTLAAPTSWYIDGRSTADPAEPSTSYNSPGIYTVDSTGTKIRGTYLAKCGGVTWDNTFGFENGDVTFYAMLNWDTALAGATPVGFFTFGCASYTSSGGADPWHPSQVGNNLVVFGLASGTTPFLNVYINGSADGGITADVNTSPTGAFAKAAWTKMRVRWENGVGVDIWVNDTLRYQNHYTGFTSFNESQAPMFGSYCTYSAGDGWTYYKDITGAAAS